MSDESAMTGSMLVLYRTEDGRTRIQCRFEDETIWLTQIQLAELFQTTVANINIHLEAIYAEDGLIRAAMIKSHSMVRVDDSREVSRTVLHHSLQVILAVLFRVRSPRGTRFRQWATARLTEYLVKSFAMDDERLKNPTGAGQVDSFDELLARSRDIRSSERRFYQKVLDTYATCVDLRFSTRSSSSELPHDAGRTTLARQCRRRHRARHVELKKLLRQSRLPSPPTE